MKQSVLRSLSEKDTVLLLETKRQKMEDLDEDALVEPHRRVQRARNKHVKNCRRAGAAEVPQVGTRGGARPINQKNRDRAEVFEDALARVQPSAWRCRWRQRPRAPFGAPVCRPAEGRRSFETRWRRRREEKTARPAR